MSVESNILDGIVTMVEALSLGPPVVKRKSPIREADVDAAQQITVSPSRTPETVSMLALGGAVKVRYYTEITIIGPNNDDFLSGLDTYTQWREQIRNLFRPPFQSPIISGVNQVYDLDVSPGEFLDPAAIQDLYDYLTVRVIVTTAE